VFGTAIGCGSGLHHLQHQGGVIDGVCYWAYVIVGRRQWNDSANAYAGVGWLESYYSAVGSGETDGAGGIGAYGAEAQSGGDAGGRASRGTASYAGCVPRIVDLAEVADHRAASVGEFVEILLA